MAPQNNLKKMLQPVYFLTCKKKKIFCPAEGTIFLFFFFLCNVLESS